MENDNPNLDGLQRRRRNPFKADDRIAFPPMVNTRRLALNTLDADGLLKSE